MKYITKERTLKILEQEIKQFLKTGELCHTHKKALKEREVKINMIAVP
jgi:hypothetical protein